MCGLDDNLSVNLSQKNPKKASHKSQLGSLPCLPLTGWHLSGLQDALLYLTPITGNHLQLTSFWLILQLKPIFAFDPLPYYFPPNLALILVILNLYLSGSQAAC